MARVDELRRRCEHMLAAGEEILLEAEAWIKLGYLALSGQGRAYLTARRIIFVRRGLGLRWGLLPSWAPSVMTIQLSSIDRLRMVRDFTRAWLWIDAVGKAYYIRLGKGPYPLLRDNPRTTEEWLHAIEERGSKPGPVIGAPV